MLFNSPTFIFLFLPLLLLLYFFVRPKAQSGFLLFCSLFFYIWAEGKTSWILLLTITVTWLAARGLAAAKSARVKSLWLAAGISADLLILILFKYSAFLTRSANGLLGLAGARPLGVPSLPLPLGISFSTFLAISFLVDASRAPAARTGLGRTSLYISFFPAIVAGPITPYRELAPQLADAAGRRIGLHEGVQRFIVGLGKKVLLADILARTANAVFAIPGRDLTFAVSWVGIAAYTLQIYFDFSGYSDMAIGLGRILGFRLAENFNYPYTARSIQDFWTRWHQSLTRWLRDYLFLPLAYGLLRRIKKERWLGIKAESWSYGIGMFLTYLLCGLWHGAAWTFVAWGVWHAAFILLERFAWGKKLKKTWRPVQHAYALLLTSLGWVFFRSSGFTQAAAYLKALAGMNRGQPQIYTPALYLNTETQLVLALAVAASLPLVPWLKKKSPPCPGTGAARPLLAAVHTLMPLLVLVAILFLSILYLANQTYQPFIYFRF